MSILADFLQAQRDFIIQRFKARGQAPLTPGSITASAFINHLPVCLEELAQVLREDGPPAARIFSKSDTARDHGRQRLQLGDDFPTLVRDYDLLRDCILESLEEAHLTPSLGELRVLSGRLSAATAASDREPPEELDTERHYAMGLFQQAPVAIAIREGPGHTCTFANDAYRALAGGDRQIVGKRLHESFPELEGRDQNYEALLDQVVATGRPVYGNEQPVAVAREGRVDTDFYNYVFAPKRNAAGQVDGVMQFAFDVTDQVHTRQQLEALTEKLRQSEEHLRRVVDVTQVGAWEVDLTTQHVVADARFRELHGLAPGDCFNVEQSLSLVHPEDRPRVAQALSDALSNKGGRHFRVEYRTHRLPSGQVRWVDARGQVSAGPAGQPARFLGTGVDITARKVAEVAREAFLEALGAQSLLGVVLYQGPQLVIEMANPLFREMVGKERDLLGKPLLEALPELKGQGFEETFNHVRQTGKPFIGRGAPTIVQRREGGERETLFLDFVCHPVRGADGNTAVLMLCHEVTHAVRARQFEQQLIGIVSHDLRNPLQAILLGTASLLRREEMDEHTTKAVARIRSAAERASRMVKDLLDFTQARLGGGIPLVPRPTDLHTLIRETVEEVQASHPERELRVEAQGEGGGSWDGDRLAQVVQNLASNAVKYSTPGTPITVRSRGDSERVELEVHNSGVPIAPEALGRLFQPMQRATAQPDSTGRSVGLGLYIVAEVVRAHGGRVDVTSSQAAGTTFTVRLPRRGGPLSGGPSSR